MARAARISFADIRHFGTRGRRWHGGFVVRGPWHAACSPGRDVLRCISLGLVGLLSVLGCRAAPEARADEGATTGSGTALEERGARRLVTVNQPAKLSSIETGQKDALGRPLSVACVTCHSLREPQQTLPASASELTDFHRGLELKHGSLGCDSCHAAERPHERLRLANGASVEMAEVQTLCSQCHGPQRKSYDRGAHGGMNGYWDTTRGPRVRNTCVDCHDPHAPAIPPGDPVLPPKDRGLDPRGGHP